MSNDKYKRLIDLLSYKTESGDLKWQETDEPDVYQASFATTSVRIEFSDGPSGKVVVIYLMNYLGTIVDQFNDEDLDGPRRANQPLSWYPKMKQLYELARRIANGSEEVLDSIIDELEG